MAKPNKGRFIWITILILLGVLFVAEARTHFIAKWVSDVVYDNRAPHWRCEDLPSLADVEKTVAAHQDVIEQIEAIDPDYIDIEIDSSSCPGKGSLTIEYPSHADRTQIEALIGETFFGIPWKGINY